MDGREIRDRRAKPHSAARRPPRRLPQPILCAVTPIVTPPPRDTIAPDRPGGRGCPRSERCTRRKHRRDDQPLPHWARIGAHVSRSRRSCAALRPRARPRMINSETQFPGGPTVLVSRTVCDATSLSRFGALVFMVLGCAHRTSRARKCSINERLGRVIKRRTCRGRHRSGGRSCSLQVLVGRLRDGAPRHRRRAPHWHATPGSRCSLAIAVVALWPDVPHPDHAHDGGASKKCYRCDAAAVAPDGRGAHQVQSPRRHPCPAGPTSSRRTAGLAPGCSGRRALQAVRQTCIQKLHKDGEIADPCRRPAWLVCARTTTTDGAHCGHGRSQCSLLCLS